MYAKVVKVGLLGLGNIGTGVFNALMLNGEGIAHREGVRFEIVRALVRDESKTRPAGVRSEILTTRFEDILEDESIGLVAEFLGGVEPAATYLTALLRAGKTVVTANKEAVAHRWPQLEAAARESGAGLYYEASVCGGIPIIKLINESLQANEISEVKGIINGTTNYILSKMSAEGMSYEEALAEASAKGIAEPDPTNDVEGYDAVCKLSILSSLAFHAHVPVDRVFRRGITDITAQEIAIGRELGYEIKLLAVGKKRGQTIEARVHPTFIPSSHPLAAVRGSFNAVYVHGNAVGSLMLYGRGAGDFPTASAIISDMVTASKTTQHRYNTFHNDDTTDDVDVSSDWETRFFLHMEVLDQPGVLAEVAGELARHGVSISSCVQRGWDMPVVPLYIVTHRTHERSMDAALKALRGLKTIASIPGIIRVED